MMRILLLVHVYFAACAPLLAEFPQPKSSTTTNPYEPVRMLAMEYDQPRPLRAWAVRIDLTHPDIEFVVTPKVKVDAGWATRSATTLDFAREEKVQLAINASPFMPLRKKTGELMKIDGLHLSRGQLVSQPLSTTGKGALLLTGDHQARLMNYPIDDESMRLFRHGVGGFYMVLQDSKNLKVLEKTEQPAKHPRTAVGISDQGRYLWWLVVDGRQPGKSEGLTYQELGEWALSLGISDLLNLDGGGSTTLVMQSTKTGQYEVINTPVGTGPPGSLRFNGNSLGLRTYRSPENLTFAQLQAIMPHLKKDKARLFLGPLNRTMEQHQIITPLRRAAFLAQLAHESGELRYMEEIASGEAYESRASLGNTQPGDGKRYKGRGPIQLTGRVNYQKAGQALGLDLEENPQQVTDPDIGCMVAGWFWNTHKLNDLADVGDFKMITRKINGGYNGLAQREKYYEQSKKVLAVP